jgi:hypothetical protein
MKKLFTFLMILALGAGIHLQLQASKPIPSFNTQIYNVANFQEKHLTGDDPNSGIKGKRNMYIVAQIAGPSKTPIIIWVYSLDGRDILGPYILYGSGEISVPIDDREWGVLIQCSDKVVVSVYTDDEGGSTYGGE